MKLAHYRKAAVAVLGAAAEIATTIPQDSGAWRYAQIIVAVATALGVYGVRNAPAPSREVERARLAEEIAEAPPSRISEQRPPRKPPVPPSGSTPSSIPDCPPTEKGSWEDEPTTGMHRRR